MKYGNYALATLLLLAATGSLAAQEFYTLSYETGTYQDLETPDVIARGIDTNNYRITEIDFRMEVYGFPFILRNSDVSTVFFHEGYVGFSTIDEKNRNVIFAIEAFYAFLTPRDSTSLRSVKVVGSGNDRILKFEWRNMGLKGNPAGDFINAQLWMKERDNSIEVHIGPNRVTANTAYFGNLSGPVIGLLLANPTLDTVHQTVHIAGAPENPYLVNSVFHPLGSTPPNGAIYRFVYNKPSGIEIDAREISPVSFHPNPFRDGTILGLPDELNGRGTVIVHDMLGHEVLRLEDARNGERIERGKLAAGIYFITLRDGNRSQFCGRLVITE